MKRVAIVCDADGTWYVRRIALSKYDRTRNEVSYICDQPIGTSYDTLDVTVRLEGMRAVIFAVTLDAKNRVKAIQKTLSSMPFKN